MPQFTGAVVEVYVIADDQAPSPLLATRDWIAVVFEEHSRLDKVVLLLPSLIQN